MRIFALFLATGLISASNLFAQVTSYHFNFHSGAGLLKASKHRDFKELWSSGYNISGGFTYELSDEIEVGLCAEHHRFPVNESRAAELAQSMGAIDLLERQDISVTTLSLLFRINCYGIENKFEAYLLFTLGWAWPNGAFVSATDDDGDFLVALPFPEERQETISFGTGIDRNISKSAGLFIELTYRIIYLRETELYIDYPRPVPMWPETHHADFYRLAAGLRYSLRY
ncbi:MAG: hypothetical protein JSU85_14055 [Candidatus Zixiibacteriota bacterium]|nr:MAG: hypothetical protein JSU85_14055 [candidate division Zixibacteria bacterium]